MNFKSLSEIQEEAEKFITGGMSSSFRANLYTGLPMYANKAQGPRFTDCTGKEFIDFFMWTFTIDRFRLITIMT